MLHPLNVTVDLNERILAGGVFDPPGFESQHWKELALAVGMKEFDPKTPHGRFVIVEAVNIEEQRRKAEARATVLASGGVVEKLLQTAKRLKPSGRPPNTFSDGMPKPNAEQYHKAVRLLPGYFETKPSGRFVSADFAQWAMEVHGIRVPATFAAFWDDGFRKRFMEWFRTHRRTQTG